MVEYRIERQLEQFEFDPNLVAVGSQCFYINTDGTRTGRSNYPVGVLNRLPNFKFKCLVAHPSTMYLRRSALDIGGYRSVFSWNGVDIAEDFDFWLRLSRQGQISISEELLTEYRQHPDQLSSQYFAGQQLGTPYISAVNIQNVVNPLKICFNDGKSEQTSIFLHLIRRNLGFRHYLASKFCLFQFQENKTSFGLIIKPLLSKFISLLQN